MRHSPAIEPDAPPVWWKRNMVTVPLRLGLSIALLVVIFAQMGDIDRDQLIPEWHRSTLLWSAAAFGFTFASFVLATMRWQRVLAALDVHQPLRRLFSHHMAGQFISNFVPTTVGGDVVRVGRLARDIEDGPVAFTSIVFERLSGWLVLPLITFIGFGINPGLTHLGPATQIPLVVGIITLVALIAVIVVLGHDRIGNGLEGREGVARFGNAIHLGIDRMREHPHSARNILISAMAYQFCVLLAAACAVEALDINKLGLTGLMAFMPAVLTLQVLPLGIGGLGIREGSLVLFLSGIDIPDEQALALGLAIYVLMVVTSLIGFPMLMFGGRRTAQRLPGPDASTAGSTAGAGPDAAPNPASNTGSGSGQISRSISNYGMPHQSVTRG